MTMSQNGQPRAKMYKQELKWISKSQNGQAVSKQTRELRWQIFVNSANQCM